MHLLACQASSVGRRYERPGRARLQADVDGSNAIDFSEFYGLWFSLTRPNEATLQEVKDILKKRQVT